MIATRLLQVLDHFTATDGRSWNQRYWENLEFYQVVSYERFLCKTEPKQEGGPAFIMIGGEAEASPGWLKFGQWCVSPSPSFPKDSLDPFSFEFVVHVGICQVQMGRAARGSSLPA